MHMQIKGHGHNQRSIYCPKRALVLYLKTHDLPTQIQEKSSYNKSTTFRLNTNYILRLLGVRYILLA